jgi:hypothetical protein
MTNSLDLDELENAALAQARQGLAPTRRERARVLQSLGVGLAAADLGTGTHSVGPEPSMSTAQGSLAGFSSQVLATGIVAGALLGFGGGLWVGLDSTPPPVHVVGAPKSPASPAESSSTPISDSSEKTVELADLAENWPQPVSGRASSDSSAQSPRESPKDSLSQHSPAKAEPTFYQELSYVRRAQAALKQKDGALALGLMTSLDELRPRGALNAERNVTKVLALCQLDRVEEARSLARRALRNDANTDVYRRRLAASCAHTNAEESVEPSPNSTEK